MAGRGDVAARRVGAALTGFSGDEAGARGALLDPAAKVRLAALSSLARLGALSVEDEAAALADPAVEVRRGACELAAEAEGDAEVLIAPLSACLASHHALLVEAAAHAVGELGLVGLAAALVGVATAHSDPLCRESAVAALGALAEAGGAVDVAARGAMLAALGDVPAVRRRAVIALSNFPDDEVAAALSERLTDRDWQVRQAVEDVLGVSGERRS